MAAKTKNKGTGKFNKVHREAEKKRVPKKDRPQILLPPILTKRGLQQGELANLVREIAVQFDSNFIRKASLMPKFNRIPTGSWLLDLALHGGYPDGLAAMIYGWESAGKTTMMLKAVASIQRKYPDRVVVWADPETTFDPVWAALHGVDTENLLIINPDSGEQCVDALEALARASEVSGLFLDSIPALVPQKLIDDSAEDKNIALIARCMASLCSKLGAAAIKERKRGHWVTFMSSNQWRYKIGVVYGDNRCLPGGVQSNFFHTTKVEISAKDNREKDEDDLEVVERSLHRFRISKSKGACLRSGDFEMIQDPTHELGAGTIDEFETVCAYAREFKVVTGKKSKKGGGYYVPFFDWSFDTKEEVFEQSKANPEFCNYLRHAVLVANRTAKGLDPLPPDEYLVCYGASGEAIHDVDVDDDEDTDDDEPVAPVKKKKGSKKKSSSLSFAA